MYFENWLSLIVQDYMRGINDYVYNSKDNKCQKWN